MSLIRSMSLIKVMSNESQCQIKVILGEMLLRGYFAFESNAFLLYEITPVLHDRTIPPYNSFKPIRWRFGFTPNECNITW